MRARHIERKSIMNKTKDLVYIAICTSLICICSWITVPSAIPFTLQTFAIFATLGLLGGKRGMIAILIYIILGIIGLPVFSSFNSGIGVILGPTGGYIIGFLFSSFLYFLLEKFIKNENVKLILGFILSLILCYLIGTIWFYYVYSANNSISLVSLYSSLNLSLILYNLSNDFSFSSLGTIIIISTYSTYIILPKKRV